MASSSNPGALRERLRQRFGTPVAVLTAAIGIAMSVTANALGSDGTGRGLAVSMAPPIALTLCLANVEFNPPVGGWRSRVRVTSTLIAAGIAAWVSYWHMVELCRAVGEHLKQAEYLIPIVVDAMIVVATMGLAEAQHAADTATSTTRRNRSSVGQHRASRRSAAATSAGSPEVSRPAAAAVPHDAAAVGSAATGSKADRERALRDYLRAHPDADKDAAAAAIGLAAPSLARYDAWRDHVQQQHEQAQSDVDGQTSWLQAVQ